MSTELMLDVSQAAEIKMAGRRAGATNADLKKLSEGDHMARVILYLRGLAKIVPIEFLIDGDAAPIVPAGWKVYHHLPMGKLDWLEVRDRLELYYVPGQQNGNGVSIDRMLKMLKKSKMLDCALNVNVLHFLVDKHPELTPGLLFSTGYMFSWGTVFEDHQGFLHVPYFFTGTDGVSEVRYQRQWESWNWYRPAVMLKR